MSSGKARHLSRTECSELIWQGVFRLYDWSMEQWICSNLFHLKCKSGTAVPFRSRCTLNANYFEWPLWGAHHWHWTARSHAITASSCAFDIWKNAFDTLEPGLGLRALRACFVSYVLVGCSTWNLRFQRVFHLGIGFHHAREVWSWSPIHQWHRRS